MKDLVFLRIRSFRNICKYIFVYHTCILLVEDRSLHTRRDNRNQEFARHSHEYVTSPRAEGRANWPLLPGGGQLDPYLSPGYPPHGMGQQGQFHMNRTSGSPRLMRPNPQHQREQVSPNSRWANPVMNQPVFYYNQSPGSNHTAASPGQAFGAQQGRGHSTSALFKVNRNGDLGCDSEVFIVLLKRSNFYKFLLWGILLHNSLKIVWDVNYGKFDCLYFLFFLFEDKFDHHFMCQVRPLIITLTVC